jgi:hypothetical protein
MGLLCSSLHSRVYMTDTNTTQLLPHTPSLIPTNPHSHHATSVTHDREEKTHNYSINQRPRATPPQWENLQADSSPRADDSIIGVTTFDLEMKMTTFWDVAPCSLDEWVDRHFTGACCLQNWTLYHGASVPPPHKFLVSVNRVNFMPNFVKIDQTDKRITRWYRNNFILLKKRE